MTPRLWLVSSIWVPAICFLLVVAFTVAAEVLPSQPFSLSLAHVLPIAVPHAYAASGAYARGDLSLAEKETNWELALSPVSQDAWLRLAKIDKAKHGYLASVGGETLNRSYDASPYVELDGMPRLTFALDNYVALKPTVRQSVDDEIRFWASQPAERQLLKGLIPKVADNQGRVAIEHALEEQAAVSRGAAPSVPTIPSLDSSRDKR